MWRHLSTGRVKKRLREIAASGNHSGSDSGNDGGVLKPEPLKAAWLLGDAAARAFTHEHLELLPDEIAAVGRAFGGLGDGEDEA